MKQDKTTPNTALLVMDFQANIMSRIPDGAGLLKNLQDAIAGARAAGIPVIYVGINFRKGFPEISLNNRSFGAIKKDSSAFPGMNEPVVFAPEITPKDDDIIVIKKRISAFAGSDLDMILRSLAVSHLIISGISTSGVVLSTVREAFDKDYVLTILSDGCADPDPQVHELLMTKIFPRQADVISAKEWLNQVG